MSSKQVTSALVSDEGTHSKISDASDRAVTAAAKWKQRQLDRGDLSGRLRGLEIELHDMKRASLAVGSSTDDIAGLATIIQKLERRMAVLEKSNTELLSLCGALLGSHEKLADAVASMDLDEA